MGSPPVTPPRISRFVSRILRYTQLNQVAHLCFRLLPLFPNAHAYPVIQPPVQVIDLVLHACNPVVVHPPSDIDFDFLKTWSDALTASTGRVFAKSVFELLHRLWMNAYVNSSAILPQRKAEILEFLNCKNTYDATFLLIHLQFQSSLKILRARLQKSLCGSFALRQQDDIVRVADARYSPFQILLIELIEVDVRQQRGKVSSLCRASYYAELMKGTVEKQASHH